MKKPRDPSKPYAVGRGKPPKSSRFKPGQSGNPKGRPKRSRNLSTDVREALQMPIVVTAGARRKSVTMQVAAILKLFEKGINGDTRALDHVVTLGARYNDDPPPPVASDAPFSADDAAILADYLARHAGLKREAGTEPSEDQSDSRGPERAARSSPAGKRSIPRRRSRRR